MDDHITLPPAVLERFKRDHQMRQSTSDEMVHHLWQGATDGQSELFFVLDAQINWNTDAPRWHDFLLGQLSPETHDPPGSGPKRPLIPFFQRWHQLGCRVFIEPLVLADVTHSRQAILKGIRKAQVLSDLVSLVGFQPVRLRAAHRQETSWSTSSQSKTAPFDPPEGKTHFLWPFDTSEEATNTEVTDEWLNANLRQFVEALIVIPDDDLRFAVENAINWHAQANSLHGLGRYIHYWAAFELLGSFFYEYLDPAYIGRPTGSELDASILRKLLDLNSKTYSKTIVDCSRLLNPTAREKIQSLAKKILPQDTDIRKTLFDKPRDEKGRELEGVRSMYEIRNDIAHGNISGLLREYLDQNAERLVRFQRVSARFILAVLNNARELCKHRSSTFQPGSARDADET